MTVMITGASSGIGAAIAERFRRRGARLALAVWGDPETGAGEDSFVREVDVRDPEAVASFVADAVAELGRIDALVTCAGIFRGGPSEQVPLDEWQDVLDVNLTGTYACIRAVLPSMLERGSGQIVTIASELGIAGEAEAAAYCASKGAIIALTKSLAREYAGAGIRVNSIAPGPVSTAMLHGAAAHATEEAERKLPIGRFGRPEEIAAAVEALTGEAGTFYVGQILSPNGGAVI